MDIISIVLTAIALSADAMSVSISNGIAVKKLEAKSVILMAVLFGGFQFLMPVLGWLLGQTVSGLIESFDHWIAFALLGFIGIKMVIESCKGGDRPKSNPFVLSALVIMAIATSIDALAVGIGFASLSMPQDRLWLSAALIGIITFVLSCCGAVLGKKLGEVFKKRAELIAGVLLCLIGLKILLEHLEIISF